MRVTEHFSVFKIGKFPFGESWHVLCIFECKRTGLGGVEREKSREDLGSGTMEQAGDEDEGIEILYVRKTHE